MTNDHSTEFNPYQASLSTSGDEIQNSDLNFSLARIAKLAFWQRTAAIMMAFCIVVIGGYFMLLSLFVAGSFAVLIVVCLLTLLLIFPTVVLWNTSVTAGRYARSGNQENQARFAIGQLQFWRTATITAFLAIGMILILANIAFVMISSAYSQGL